MSREVNILNYIYENENITQRDIANHVGMSLGGVNLLLKKMAAAGWIRILALKNPKLVQYILTPEGMQEKTSKTYRYITRTYRNILKTRQVIMTMLKNLEDEGYETVCLYGEKDEVFEIVSMIIEEELGGFGEKYEYVGSVEKLERYFNQKQGCKITTISQNPIDQLHDINQPLSIVTPVVLIWNIEYNQRLEERGIKYINILEKIRLDEE